MTTEQQEFEKIDRFLGQAKTKYGFELANYNITEPKTWYARIYYHLYDDTLEILGTGSTRLEALQDLNRELEADPTYETTDFSDPEYNHD